MPTIHIQIGGATAPEQLNQVAQAVQEVTERVLGKARAVTAVFIDTLSSTHWWVGGQSLAQQGLSSYCLTIRITDETNTKAEKAQYIAEIHQRMQDLLGPIHPCSYVHVHDVRATAYGYDGQTQAQRYQALQARSTCSP